MEIPKDRIGGKDVDTIRRDIGSVTAKRTVSWVVAGMDFVAERFAPRDLRLVEQPRLPTPGQQAPLRRILPGLLHQR